MENARGLMRRDMENAIVDERDYHAVFEALLWENSVDNPLVIRDETLHISQGVLGFISRTFDTRTRQDAMALLESSKLMEEEKTVLTMYFGIGDKLYTVEDIARHFSGKEDITEEDVKKIRSIRYRATQKIWAASPVSKQDETLQPSHLGFRFNRISNNDGELDEDADGDTVANLFSEPLTQEERTALAIHLGHPRRHYTDEERRELTNARDRALRKLKSPSSQGGETPHISQGVLGFISRTFGARTRQDAMAILESAQLTAEEKTVLIMYFGIGDRTYTVEDIARHFSGKECKINRNAPGQNKLKCTQSRNIFPGVK